jgi:hypothetical protein
MLRVCAVFFAVLFSSAVCLPLQRSTPSSPTTKTVTLDYTPSSAPAWERDLSWPSYTGLDQGAVPSALPSGETASRSHAYAYACGDKSALQVRAARSCLWRSAIPLCPPPSPSLITVHA